MGTGAVAVVAEGREDGVAEALRARVRVRRARADGGRARAVLPTPGAAAVPIRAAAGAVTLVRYLMIRFRSGGRVVGSGRRSAGDRLS
ncbi:hypothetical protein J2Z21_005201 [Streptomyces griseochromogenes]|uniref:Uncharacterized protein n=1 Tax=Streptomyces griseochromogenes TaxID=68214 RepID=A0ABS4LYC2_9ACTN|nr:hypothetical protein [Streptomyces griseochromogenes]